MEFPRPGWFHHESTPKEQSLEKEIEELKEEHRMLDLEKGLDEWHIEVLEQEHGIDHLTGVHTRKAFEAELSRAFEVMSRKGEEQRHGVQEVTEVSVIFIDLDNFKTVNDTLGHGQGDATLKKAAALLKRTLREEDTLARFGGDEFVALLLNTEEGDAEKVAEKLRAALAGDPELAMLSVTGSIGVASTRSTEASTPETLVKNADEAVYIAKRGGRNQVAVYRGA